MGKGNELSPEFFMRYGIPSDCTEINVQSTGNLSSDEDYNRCLGAEASVVSSLKEPTVSNIRYGNKPTKEQIEELFHQQFDVVS